MDGVRQAMRHVTEAQLAVAAAMVDLHNARCEVFEPSPMDKVKRALGGHPLDYPPLEEDDGHHVLWLRNDGSRS